MQRLSDHRVPSLNCYIYNAIPILRLRENHEAGHKDYKSQRSRMPAARQCPLEVTGKLLLWNLKNVAA